MPSTVIRSHQYLEQTGVLAITFISGTVYHYYGVSSKEYASFKQAFSKGSFFNRYIKPFHPFKKISR